MIEKIKSAAEALRHFGVSTAETGIILGTGLGKLVDHIQIIQKIDYSEIPNFPISTVESHKGQLIYGKLGAHTVLAMQGRFHYYEGYSQQQITFPVRVMKELGVKQLLVTNAAGAMNLSMKKGSLMLIDDHINLLPDNPLRGKHEPEFGPRFPDMSRPYSPLISNRLEQLATDLKIVLHKGVYIAVAGPNLETRAEYRYLRMIGGDAVGMSTVPEVIVANQIGIPAAAISVLTDECDPDHLVPANLSDILAVAALAEDDLVKLIKAYLMD
ncbi:MAG: purine-nucleoside phosphorylase [Bacteroidetes bacterium]|nr:purine-nucleoside phosphorylase [Bacteroidota bacterium]